jgi:methyl-branched lipid omega-hydroxylase
MGVSVRINGQRPPEVALDDIDLGSWDFWRRDDEHRDGAFATLRRDSPIRFFPDLERKGEVAGGGHWALTRHEHVRFASRCPEIFSSRPNVQMVDFPPEVAEYLGSMLALDDPRHQRLRALVNRAFTPKVLASVEESIRVRARHLVSAMVKKRADRFGDFVADIAGPLPLQVICDMMGIPGQDRARVFKWTDAVMGFGDPDIADDISEFHTAAKSLGEYGQALAESRRASSCEDLTTSLVNTEVGGERLTSAEIASFFILLVVAGTETTRNAISHGLHALTRFPDQRQLWWSDMAGLRQTAVEEILRWSTPVVYMRRTLTRDCELDGVRMSAGQKVTMWYTSANRDEVAFDDPWTFDVRRQSNPHFAFGGGGVHFCLGAGLARREISAAFDELQRQVPDITVVGEPAPLLSALAHGIKHLPVIW